ncbi:MAG: NYN domain-containing protein [Chloroflexota bacterium]
MKGNSSMTDDRVMVFIDGSNLYHSLKKFFNRADIDIGKFCNRLLGKRRLIRIYYYNALVGRREEPERYKDQQTFLTSVGAVPYTELRLGHLIYNNWPNVPPFEKGVDVQLATDLLTHSFKNNYDTAILVAGDNDYVGALQAVKDNGKHVEIALFGKERTSRQLRDVSDRVMTMDGRFLRGCWKQNNPGARRQITAKKVAPEETNHPQPKQA